MPKFVIGRQYLVPMYQHIVVEVENLETACEMAVSDDIDWDTQKMDSDNARKTTITNAKLIPEDKFDANTGAGALFDRAERPRGYGLDTFLYENEAETGPLLVIHEQSTEDEYSRRPLTRPPRSAAPSAAIRR
jgi:hypothetical protein